MTLSSDVLDQTPVPDYQLDEQIGFILRQAAQRHAAVFADTIVAALTPTQFAAIARLYEHGAVSQNRLGRLTAMDVATIKGVVDRLRGRGLARTRQNPEDKRYFLVELTPEGEELARRAIPKALEISARTLNPLTPREREILLRLLMKIS